MHIGKNGKHIGGLDAFCIHYLVFNWVIGSAGHYFYGGMAERDSKGVKKNCLQRRGRKRQAVQGYRKQVFGGDGSRSNQVESSTQSIVNSKSSKRSFLRRFRSAPPLQRSRSVLGNDFAF